MHYTVYQIMNISNSKIYIGYHQTENPMDNYMGSGKYLGHAKAKYGMENFTKKILFDFDNREEMISKEKELVNENFIARSDVYNLVKGGKGGFTTAACVKGGKISGNIHKVRIETDKKYRVKHMVACAKNIYSMAFLGRNHTDESLSKMSGPRLASKGKNNSQFGSMWITNGSENKKIKRVDSIPEGFYKGRKIIKEEI
ncbi:MAG: hypothetical protein COA84_13530 [Robiginitomaculum sp.]|nr:MAG: hypothetical protein COA84_13530 [Robiginitomaculum sp.]